MLTVAVLLAAVSGTACYFWSMRDGAEGLRLPGVVETQEVRLGSKLGGRVAEVLVTEGALVEAGQPLVRMEVPELEAQKLQAKARFQAAKAELERARNGPRAEEIESARETVKAAKSRLKRLEIGTRPEEIRQCESELESADADLKLSREEYDRADRLLRQGSLSRAEHDIARATRDRANRNSGEFRYPSIYG